ncbi:MAG TPA: cupin domain-containing protein [Rhizomicrobium sp.]|nr:cupin domain-containing protein [Rhizomicrobium sp.]
MFTFNKNAILTCAALAILATPALAQSSLRDTPAEDFKFIPRQDTDKRLMTPAKGQTVASDVISDHENYYVLFAKRVDHGNISEIHDHWVDHITILEGEGTLTYGGTLNGAKATAPGEWRGGTLADAKTQKLGPGDSFLVPAGMPHRLDPASGQQLKYLVFKARR